MYNYASEIKRRISAKEVFEAYGIHVNRDGYACCPFHSEKTPSCKVYPGDRGWHCFGCHAGGDVLDFMHLYFGLDLPSAEAQLNDDFNLGLPIGRQLSQAERIEADRQARERKRKSDERRERLDGLERAYNKALDEFTTCDIMMAKCAPVSQKTGLTAAFCWAAQNIDRAWAELKEAEAALFRFRQEENG